MNGTPAQQIPQANGQTSSQTDDQTVSSLPQETIDFAGKVFNLARHGEDELLGAYMEAGSL